MATTDSGVTRFGHFQVLELGADGQFIDAHRGRETVSFRNLTAFLDQSLVIPNDATDVFVWVHGWRNDAIEHASGLADQVLGRLDPVYTRQPGCYPGLADPRCCFILVTWPSSSAPTYRGYARIRERAHQMTEHGHASRVLAFLLGYLNDQRGGPPGSAMLRMPGGQYLHCVGHSFGGRFLAQAVTDAANPQTAMLPLRPANPRYPFAVDSLLLFQMAAPPDIFAGRFRPLIENAPLTGPVCLTFSKHDQATGWLHALAEHRRGVGCVGARQPAELISTVRLRAADDPYPAADLRSPIVNVDASWRYRRRRPPSGAHSDIGYDESAHLLLTLASFAR